MRYSISAIIDDSGNKYGIGVHLDSTLLDNLTPAERVEMVKEYVKEIGGESFTAYDQNGNAVDITIAKPNAKFKNQHGKRVAATKDLTNKHINNQVKQEAIALVDELITTAEYDASSNPRYPHGWLDDNGQNDWEYWTTYIQDKNGAVWEATLNIANSADGKKILYDISPIKKVGQSVKSDTIPTNNSVAQGKPKVNGQNSLSPKNQPDEGMFPMPWQIKGEDVALEFPLPPGYEGNVNADDSTGAAPSGFDPVSHLQYKYGSLPEGENAVRQDSQPGICTSRFHYARSIW